MGPMAVLRVALLQLQPCANDQDANLRKGEAFCRRARAMDADIALFPEMWNIGYTSFCPDQGSEGDVFRAPESWTDSTEAEDPSVVAARAAWRNQAISQTDPWFTHFRRLARELGLAIGLTYLQCYDVAPRNAISVIDHYGEVVLTYAKVHTCDFSPMEWALTPGTEFPVCDLDTASGPVRVGAMICFDREFPESARILMLRGAEIILVPNACTMEHNRLAQLRTRAFENLTAVALANYAAPKENGHSVAFHPVAFNRDGSSRDLLVVEAGEQEGIFIATFDLDEIRDCRRREVWGNAFRRPHRYRQLTQDYTEPPFVRVDRNGTSIRQFDR